MPPVVPGNACKAKGTAVGSEGAGLTIGLTKEGQSPVPPGFNRKDIVFVILVSGATVSLAAALGGAGGSGGAAGGATVAKGGGSNGFHNGHAGRQRNVGGLLHVGQTAFE